MLHRLFGVFAVVALALPLVANAGTENYQEGVAYKTLSVPNPGKEPGKVEVREFFFYGCPHCYHAEPLVEKWLKHKPADVDFERTPVLFLQGGEPLARAFYIAEEKGIMEKITPKLFDAIHKDHEPLYTEDALANFFAKYGVSKLEFDSLYSSFGISTKVRQADALTRQYQISGVPSFVVGGKYLVLRENLSGEPETFKVIDFLVNKVKQERAAKATGGK